MPLVPIAPFRTPRRVAAAQTAQLFNVVAPVGGLNYRDPISQMAPTDALILTNFIARQSGTELRKGWKYHTDTIAESIESIFSFKATGAGEDKVFAAAAGAIYDVTVEPATTAVPTTNSDADEWKTTQFSTPADTFLLAVSPGAGYWTYDDTNGWVDRTASCTGLPTTVNSVTVFKNRVWFTAEGDTNVYYMDSVDVVVGSVTSFPMGSLLRNGGSVAALINWTIDAGFSVDDFLVCVGTEGDIGVWQGTDPSSATDFGLKGVWYVGPVPRHGRFYTAFGGDVMIVSQQGLVPMSKLITGQFVDQAQGPASKIQTVLNPLVQKLLNEKYWDVFMVPAESLLIIKLPAQSGVYQQFAMNVVTGAWCLFQGIPMRCSTMLGGDLYFGTFDGYSCRGLYGDRDGVDLEGEGGNFIEGEIQSAFNAFGTPANLKKFGLVKPMFIAPIAPSVKLQINVQYTFANVGGSPSFSQDSEARWDTSVWNVARWVGATNTYQAWAGATGLGYLGSICMKVRGVPGTVYTNAQVMSEVGGVM